MHYKTKRILILTVANLLQLAFVCFMFYKSEPKYKNDSYGKPIVGDYVTVFLGNYDGFGSGMVVQTDSIGFVVNLPFNLSHQDGLTAVGFASPIWRIIGKGTFYHRVNNYIGFNIMLITTLIIVVFFCITARAETLLIYKTL